MNLRKLILTENDCYKTGAKMKPKGAMLHSTAANNPRLKRYVGPDDGELGVNKNGNHWNTPRPDGKKKCVHAFIGKLEDGRIATYQTLPWTIKGWHAGHSLGNNEYIGVEMCEDDLTDATYFNAVYKEAVELFAYLCKEFNFTEKEILCHSEGYKKGIASNHCDVMHWFPKHGKSMDTFRADVKKLLESEEIDMEELKKLTEEVNFLKESLDKIGDRLTKLDNPMVYNYVDENMPEWARPTIQKLVDDGVLVGNEKGELGLTDEMLRMIVILSR